MTARFHAALTGDLREIMARELLASAAAAQTAVTDAKDELQETMRRRTRANFRGTKLANTWRSKIYGPRSFGIAAVIWTKAPEIFDAAEGNGPIRAKNGKYLAVRLPGAGLTSDFSVNGRAIRRRAALADFEGRDDIHFIPLDGGWGRVLVARRSKRAKRSTLLFLLVREVRPRARRMDFEGTSRTIGARIPDRIIAFLTRVQP